MSDIKPFPEFISHKKLKTFLSTAPQEGESIDINNLASNETKDILSINIRSWLNSSENLIASIKEGDNYLVANKGSKSLLALGAMEAYINMAIQALKAYESGEEN